MSFSTVKNAIELFDYNRDYSLDALLGIIKAFITDAETENNNITFSDFKINDPRSFCIYMTFITNTLIAVAQKYEKIYKNNTQNYIQSQTSESVDKLKKFVFEHKDSFDNMSILINKADDEAKAQENCEELTALINKLVTIRAAMIADKSAQNYQELIASTCKEIKDKAEEIMSE